MKKTLILLSIYMLFVNCQNQEKSTHKNEEVRTEKKIFPKPTFTLSEANKLLDLPLHCVENEYPNKLGQTIGGDKDLQSPEALHPIFYGCFDWHSAVHGYWSMVTLLDKFPNVEKADGAKAILEQNITPEKVAIELAYFQKDINKSYERTYGWAWLLKLSEALRKWDDPMAKQLEVNLQPLSDEIVRKYKDFLPKLVYPIRVGEHSNTAFGLTFAYDYALTFNDVELKELIEQKAKEFYAEDSNCPIGWEPSGFDFLSPCMEEIDIMRRIYSEEEFLAWIDQFQPNLSNVNYDLAVGEVRDRTDGKLVHLDGLNFSRAWVLYGLANQYDEYAHLTNLANEHVAYSYPNLVGDSYEGGHWLGSFAIYALISSEK